MTTTATPLLSVVVLGYNQFDRTTGPCLQSLIPWIDDPEIEIIVFDNASPDGSGERTQRWCQEHPGVIFQRSTENLGYAGGMNQAANFAQGKWLLLVNNDTEFPAHTLDALKKVIDAAPKNVAMLGPVTNAAGNGQRLYDPSKTKTEWLELGARLNTHPTGLYLPTYRCDFFCVAIRCDAWHQLNGLDTIFGRGYYEDFDFSLRLRAAGFDQAITEDVFIYHQGSATFSKNPELHALIRRNKKIMKRRHKGIKFKHAREENLEVIKNYATKKNSNLTSQIISRSKIRIKATRKDLPKSKLKVIWWIFKLKFIYQVI